MVVMAKRDIAGSLAAAMLRGLDEFSALPKSRARAQDVGMRTTALPPSPAFAPFVRSFMIVETDDAATRQPLPGTGVVLGIRYRGGAFEHHGERRTRLPDAAFTGVLDRARWIHTAARSGVVLANFREGGAREFFAQPLHELFGGTASLDDLVPAGELARAADEVAAAATDRERVGALERLLASRRRGLAPDRLVDAAVAAIHEARGSLRIAALAEALEIGQDRLEKRFRRAVGASPKQLATILRVRHAALAHRPGQGLAQLALEAGYADQSHFIREFRAFFGESPGRFFATRAHGAGGCASLRPMAREAGRAASGARVE